MPDAAPIALRRSLSASVIQPPQKAPRLRPARLDLWPEREKRGACQLALEAACGRLSRGWGKELWAKGAPHTRVRTLEQMPFYPLKVAGGVWLSGQNF
jgi:hypothetical protein